jgi:hypothetical protein
MLTISLMKKSLVVGTQLALPLAGLTCTTLLERVPLPDLRGRQRELVLAYRLEERPLLVWRAL